MRYSNEDGTIRMTGPELLAEVERLRKIVHGARSYITADGVLALPGTSVWQPWPRGPKLYVVGTQVRGYAYHTREDGDTDRIAVWESYSTPEAAAAAIRSQGEE